jgi:hypothetical protein
MKIVVFKGQSRYGALRAFADEIIQAFAAQGDAVAVLDLTPAKSTRYISDWLKAIGPVDFCFSFQIFGSFVDPDGKTISDITGAPHVIQYVDYPLTQIDELRAISPKCALLTVDPSHVVAIEQIFGPDHFAYVGFNPHGGVGEQHPLPDDAASYAAERPIPILFTGSFYAPVPICPTTYPDRIKELFQTAGDLALSQEWIAPLTALDQIFAVSGLDLGNEEIRSNVQMLRQLVGFVNERVRQVRREKFLTTAAQLGLPLTVYGMGYEQVLDRFPNIDYRGSADIREIVELMRQSQLVISLNANFGEGSHERPLSAMRAGAAVASERSAFYEREFDAAEIALFHWNRLESDLAGIGALAQNPEALFAMAKAGQAKASHHRWADRIGAITAAAHSA